MKKIIFFSVIIALMMFQNSCTKRCINCSRKTLPFYNGSSMDSTKASADVAVDPRTHVIINGDTMTINAKIIATNQNNGSAWKVRIIVLLPVESTILDYTKNNACLVYDNLGNTDTSIHTGYIEYFLNSLDRNNELNQGEEFDFTVKILKSKKYSKFMNVGIMAFSQIPDDILCNNYWYYRDSQSPFCNDAFIEKMDRSETLIENGLGKVIPGLGGDWEFIPCKSLPSKSCWMPVEVPEICQYVLNCPGCGPGMLCTGILVFEGIDYLDAYIQTYDPVNKVFNNAFVASKKGSDLVFNITKQLDLKNARILFKSHAEIKNNFKAKVYYKN